MHFTLETGLLAAIPFVIIALLCLILIRGQIASLKSAVERNTAECERLNNHTAQNARRTTK